MSMFAVQLTSVIVTFSLMLYSFVIAFQGTVLVIETVAVRGLPTNFFYPALFQNLGITAAMIGLASANTVLSLVGALLVAIAMLIASKRSHALYRLIEIPLLCAGIISVGAIAAVRGVGLLIA